MKSAIIWKSLVAFICAIAFIGFIAIIYFNSTVKSLVLVNAADLALGIGPITGAANGSAYDYVNSAIFAARVNKNVLDMIDDKKELTVLGDFSRTTRAMLKPTADAVKLTFVVNFSDDSVVNFVYSANVVFEKENIFSAENMPIVNARNKAQFLGEIKFNSEISLNNFFRTLAYLEVPITTSGAQAAGTGSCQRDTNGGIACMRPL